MSIRPIHPASTGKGIILFLLFSLFLFQCQADQQKEDSPEEVLRIYQKHFDNSDFKAAMALSTVAEAKRLEELEGVLSGIPKDSLKLTTIFHTIDCQIEEEIANCDCVMEDEEETYIMPFRLRKVDGYWKVDIPED